MQPLNLTVRDPAILKPILYNGFTSYKLKRPMMESESKQRIISLLDIILDLFEKSAYSGSLPKGVSQVEIITPEAIRVLFMEKVNYNLLQQIALENGFSINFGEYGLRIEDRGHIVARVGSQSDPGGDRNIFLYLFPKMPSLMSMYMRATAIRFGILDSSASKMNIELLINYNLKVIRLVEKYRKIIVSKSNEK